MCTKKVQPDPGHNLCWPDYGMKKKQWGTQRPGRANPSPGMVALAAATQLPMPPSQGSGWTPGGWAPQGHNLAVRRGKASGAKQP